MKGKSSYVMTIDVHEFPVSSLFIRVAFFYYRGQGNDEKKKKCPIDSDYRSHYKCKVIKSQSALTSCVVFQHARVGPLE